MCNCISTHLFPSTQYRFYLYLPKHVYYIYVCTHVFTYCVKLIYDECKNPDYTDNLDVGDFIKPIVHKQEVGKDGHKEHIQEL